MRWSRAAQQVSLRAVAGSDAFIKSTSQILRRASTGIHGDEPAHAGQGSLVDGSSSDSESKFRPGVKSLRNPRRIEFYHRRHREVKKFEKKQDRIHHLRAISHEKQAHGQVGIAQAAAAEAERLESPWLASNIPVKPPTYASVSSGQGTLSKTAVFDGSVRSTQINLDLRQETKSLDVLNLKVGYAVDAQYALPDEVKAFILDQTTFCLYGVDKNQVTQIASNIRRIRPPEPYKGAGIRIVGETIKLKERKVK